MSATRFEIRAGAYYDSVVLMQLQRSLAGLPGVEEAGVVMATEANRALLTDRALSPPGSERAAADDLLIVIRAADDHQASSALEQVDELLTQRSARPSQGFTPKSLKAAAGAGPQPVWVLISVPGRFAAGVAGEALDLGRHVFLYSDNVPLADEVALKRRGAELGLLVMGPDCGTAMINGIGLGFANRVRRGPIGLVAASGTGLQAVSVGVHQRGSGISQAIGTGGRDLSEEVGAITARQGLDLLSRDPQTEVIGLISKPPSPKVAADVLAAARATGKPVVVYLVGTAIPAEHVANLHFARSLDEAAEMTVSLAARPLSVTQDVPRVQGKRRYLRGLFSGGTLAYDALLGLQLFLVPLTSNAPIHAWQTMADPLHSHGHAIVDLGEDEFTVGRLHPMMDNQLRIQRMRQEAEDPETAIILLDVVLGEGSHPDPAGELEPIIGEITSDAGVETVALVVGTDEDPQGLNQQVAQLEAAGAVVFRNTTDAVRYCVARLAPEFESGAGQREVDLSAFVDGLSAINVGVHSFASSLESQGAEVIQVDWRPPAGGNEKLMNILARMKG